MTQTTTLPNPPLDAPTDPDIPLHPSDILMSLIVAFLAPMFLSASAGDLGFARMAAIETVNAYRLRNQADLMAVAQIIAFGLAALGSLSLSMADELSLSMTLRLRGNANALNRSAEQNRRVLRETHANHPMPHPAALPVEPEAPIMFADDGQTDAPEALLSAAAAQRLAAEAEARLHGGEQTAAQAAAPLPAQVRTPTSTPIATAETRNREMWAIAMVQEAAEVTASLPGLPPAERPAASIRAAALSSAANELLTRRHTAPPIPRPGPMPPGITQLS